MVLVLLSPASFAAPGDIEAQWTFSGGNSWSGGGTVSSDESDTAGQSLRLSSGETATSPMVDVSSEPAVEVSFWWSRGSDQDDFTFFGIDFNLDPEPGEDLIVEYFDGSGWQEVATIPGNGPADEKGAETFQIPQADLNAQFQVRARNTGTAAGFGARDLDDRWFIDTVTITEIAAPTSGLPWAEYRMDESAWNGISGEVMDASGNGRDGTAQGGATTAGTGRAVPGDPGTCRYGVFDGNDDYVAVSNLSNTLNATATLTFWIHTTQTGNDTGWQAPGIAGVEEPGGADDIFWGWIDASGRIGISVGNDYASDQKSVTAIDDGNWHHVALTRDAASGQTRVFVDGSLERTGTSGTGTIGNAFSSIGRIEDTGGTPEYFQGDLDEVRVYDAVLTQSEVQSVRAATHACSAASGPIAWYQLDETSYDGTAGEVGDDSGNGNDGRTTGNVSAYPANDPDARVCSGATVADNTRVGVIDAIDTGVDVDSTLGDEGSINFWFWSPTRWRQLGTDRMLFDASEPAGGTPKYFYLALTDATNAGGPSNRGARLAFGLEDDSDADFRFETSRIDVDRDTWVHIGVTWDLPDEEMQVFVNGALADTWSIAGATDQLGNLETLFLGDNRGNYQVAPMNGNSANGRFDEVRLYDRAIGASQMAADRDATHPCGPGGVDHFELAHDGAGINCRPEPVTLSAVDASGNPVTDYTGSVDLSTSTNNGDWSIDTGGGTLSDPGADDGQATYTFVTGDNGEVVLDLRDTHDETVNVGATDGSATDDDAEGSIVFRPYGFELTPNPIPTQIAGKPFDITLTAVGELPTDPGCNVVEEYDGSRDLKFWFDYEDPGSGSVDVTIDGNGIGTTESGATDQAVGFSSGVATLPVRYADAGEIQLHAQDDSGIGEPPAGTTDEIVAGGTNPFVVRPFGFYLDFDPDGNGTYDDRAANGSCGTQTSCSADAAGDVFTTAGTGFAMRIAAVVWQSADDADNDGRPDGNRVLADNAETPNFGQEITAETVDIAHALVAPTGGVSGSLANSTGLGGFAGGVRAMTDLRYNEVGIVDIDAALSDGAYLGTADVTGTVADVGRFIPADFDQTATDGLFRNVCAAVHTYIGQQFSYESGALPTLTVTARNDATPPATTRNYTGSFAKLVATDIDRTGPTTDGSQNGADGSPLEVAPSLSTGSLSDNGDGSLTYTFASDDDYRYERNLDRDGNGINDARVAPFDSDLTVTIDAIQDSDGVEAPAGNREDVTPDATRLRFGRLVIDNAAGAETAPVEQLLRAEYFESDANGDRWLVNTDDGCTALTLGAGANEIQLANDDDPDGLVAGDQPIDVAGGTTAIQESSPLTMTSGTAVLTFSAPGAGNTGWVDTTTLLTGGEHPYLAVDPEGDGTWTTDPTGRVTFGIYTGPASRILMREVPAN